MNPLSNVSVILLALICTTNSSPQRNRKVQATFIGDLIDTDHKVEGEVYIINENTLAIDKFGYDGNGFGVYIHVATEGSNLDDYAANKILVPYPTGSEGQPIEEPYDGSGQLIIDLKQVGVRASDVKWLSVWCTVFELSFGHVEF